MRILVVFLIIGLFSLNLNAGRNGRYGEIVDHYDHEVISDEDASLLAYYRQTRKPILSQSQMIQYCISPEICAPGRSFQSVAETLGVSKHPRAFLALTRCVSEPWPDEMNAEQALNHAIPDAWNYSLEKLNSDIAKGKMEILAACAKALVTMDNPEAIPHLERLLVALKPQIEKELAKADPETVILLQFSIIANALSALGSKAGIDAMIEQLDNVPTESPEMLLQYLRVSTKKNWGPEWTQPIHQQKKDIRRWKSFWKHHRENFVIDRAFAKSEIAFSPLVTKNTHLRDALFVLSHKTGYGEVVRTEDQEKALEDLIGKSQRLIDTVINKEPWRLAIIADDTDELGRVREEALTIWATRKGKDPLPELRKRVLKKGSGVTATDSLRDLSLSLICQISQSECVALARQLFDDRDEALQPHAVAILLARPDVCSLVMPRFSDLDDTSRFNAVQRMLYESDQKNACPCCRSVFVSALYDPSPSVAYQAYVGLTRSRLLDSLASAEKEALVQWHRDPEFVSKVIWNAAEESFLKVSTEDLTVAIDQLNIDYYKAPRLLRPILDHLDMRMKTSNLNGAEKTALEKTRDHAKEMLKRSSEKIAAYAASRLREFK